MDILRLEVRSNAKEFTNNYLGELRSVASQAFATGLTEDEEEFFRLLLKDYAIGVTRAVADIVTVDKVGKMFDPFQLDWSRDGNSSS